MSRHAYRCYSISLSIDGAIFNEDIIERGAADARFRELEQALSPAQDTVQLFGWLAETGEPHLLRESWYGGHDPSSQHPSNHGRRRGRTTNPKATR